MAYPYGDVNQALQNLSGTFERFSDRRAGHKERMAEIALRGEQLRSQQDIDRARIEYEQWADTPMSLRDAVINSPGLSRNPAAKEALLGLAEQKHEALGTSLGDMIVTPRAINTAMGEYRAFMAQKNMEQGRRDYETGRDKVKMDYETGRDEARMKHEKEIRDAAKSHWEITYGPKGEIGYRDLEHPEKFFLAPTEVLMKKGGKGSGGGGDPSNKDYLKDPHYKEISQALVEMEQEDMVGGAIDPLTSAITPWTEEQKKRRDTVKAALFEDYVRIRNGYDPIQWDRMKGETRNARLKEVKAEVDTLKEAAKNKSLPELQQIIIALTQEDPIKGEMFKEVMVPRMEELYKQQGSPSLKSQKGRGGVEWADEVSLPKYNTDLGNIWDDLLYWNRVNLEKEAQARRERQGRVNRTLRPGVLPLSGQTK